jgi:hypothetical protein
MKSFSDVLAEAIADIVDHGFDSMERIERWKRELRLAAETSLVSPASLEQQLNEGLAAIYKKMVDQGGVLKYNPGVARYTLENIKPALRSELDRRIIASANLIKLKRAEAIDKTLARFEGWSTSIHPGGVSAEKKSEVKKNVRKSLASLPFEERRVLIDQGHKLVSTISEIVAADGGAIAGRWRSNYRQAGYDYREDHKERDDKIYLIRDSWAHRAGLVKRAAVGYYDEISAPGQEPFCRCYMIWIYNIRDLPEAMLTVKGRDMLAAVRAKIAGGDITARTDAADDRATQRDAKYLTWWPGKVTRCVRCSMFQPGLDPRANQCTAVEGSINFNGHCALFEIQGARTDDAGPVPEAAVGYEAMRRRLDRLQRQANDLDRRRLGKSVV